MPRPFSPGGGRVSARACFYRRSSRSAAPLPERSHPCAALRALALFAAEVAVGRRPFAIDADDGEAFAAVLAPRIASREK